MFLPVSIDEYQMPGVRKELFEQYVQKYLASSEKKDHDQFDEKVIGENKHPAVRFLSATQGSIVGYKPSPSCEKSG